MTFLTSPKRFQGPSGEIQSRAIRSWRAVAPDAQVIVYGSHPDDQAAIESCGATPVTADDASRLPTFPEIVAFGERNESSILAYLNCDILLLPSFSKAVEACRRRFERFLMIGQRLDLAEGVVPEEPTDHWMWDPVQMVRDGKASLHPPAGSDYFVFPAGTLTGIGDLMIGRAGYDNAIISHCLRRGITIVDASMATLAYHQFHDYGHLAGGGVEVAMGDDAMRNFSRIGSWSRPSLLDTTHLLRSNGLFVRNRCRGDWARHVEVLCRFHLGSERLGQAAHLMRRAVRKWRPRPAEWLIQDVWK